MKIKKIRCEWETTAVSKPIAVANVAWLPAVAYSPPNQNSHQSQTATTPLSCRRSQSSQSNKSSDASAMTSDNDPSCFWNLKFSPPLLWKHWFECRSEATWYSNPCNSRFDKCVSIYFSEIACERIRWHWHLNAFEHSWNVQQMF